MNEQLQQALTAILNKTMSGVDAGVSFLSAEIPDVIHQLLMWKLAEACLLLAVFTAVAILGGVAIRKSYVPVKRHMRGSSLYYGNSGNDLEKEGKELMAENAGAMPFAIFGLIFGVIALFVFAVNGTQKVAVILQIWLAPKIYLIEYAASLAK